jgi:hypothetical protein
LLHWSSTLTFFFITFLCSTETDQKQEPLLHLRIRRQSALGRILLRWKKDFLRENARPLK